jgi:hypothetical protein
MKTLVWLAATLPLLVLLAEGAEAQYTVAYDTCAPHRAGYYGYGGGYAAMARGGATHARIQPFAGMVNPRYAYGSHRMAAAEPHHATRLLIERRRELLQQEVRERQAAAQSEPSDEPPPSSPPESYVDRYRHMSRTGTPPHGERPRPDLSAAQPKLMSAASYQVRTAGAVVPEVETMSSGAADKYAARADAAMARLKLQLEARRLAARTTVVSGGRIEN